MNSNRFGGVALGAFLTLLAAGTALAHGDAGRKSSVPAAQVRPVTLEGELVDTQCWYTHNGEGREHADCARLCARGGQDLAFLDQQSGMLYSIIAQGHGKNPNEGMYAHVGKRVRVKGTAYTRAENRGLLVQSIAAVIGGPFEDVESSYSSSHDKAAGARK